MLGWAIGLPAVLLQIERNVQRAIQKPLHRVVFRQEMRRENRIPIAAQLPTPILNEATEAIKEYKNLSEEEELLTQLLTQIEEDKTHLDQLQALLLPYEALEQTFAEPSSELEVY